MDGQDDFTSFPPTTYTSNTSTDPSFPTDAAADVDAAADTDPTASFLAREEQAMAAMSLSPSTHGSLVPSQTGSHASGMDLFGPPQTQTQHGEALQGAGGDMDMDMFGVAASGTAMSQEAQAETTFETSASPMPMPQETSGSAMDTDLFGASVDKSQGHGQASLNASSSDPYSAFAAPTLDSEHIRKWREERDHKVREKEDMAKTQKTETMERAQKDVELFYEERAAKIYTTEQGNRDDEREFIAIRDADPSGKRWEQVHRQMEHVARPKHVYKDTTRMRAILTQLKNEPMAAPGNA